MNNDWKKCFYSKKGISHSVDGIECQDKVKIVENENCIIAALADGLGSLKNSAFAAQSTVNTICSYFINNAVLLDRKNIESKQLIAGRLITEITKAIQTISKEKQFDISTADCTACFTFVSKAHNYALIGIIGDSAVCVINNKESFCLNGGEKHLNSTNTVLDHQAIDKMLIKVIDLSDYNNQGFILSSDGLENELYRKGSTRVKKNAEIYFNSLLNQNNPDEIIIKRINSISDTPNTHFTDDISIAVVSRATEPITLKGDPTWLCVCGCRNKLENRYCSNCSADFIKVYNHVDVTKPDKDSFFEDLNDHPNKESEIISKSNLYLKSTPKEAENRNSKSTLIIVVAIILLVLCLLIVFRKKIMPSRNETTTQISLQTSEKEIIDEATENYIEINSKSEQYTSDKPYYFEQTSITSQHKSASVSNTQSQNTTIIKHSTSPHHYDTTGKAQSSLSSESNTKEAAFEENAESKIYSETVESTYVMVTTSIVEKPSVNESAEKSTSKNIVSEVLNKKEKGDNKNE